MALERGSQTLGGALGIAIFSAIATSRTRHLLSIHAAAPDALTSGFRQALLAASVFLLAAAAIATRATNTRGQPAPLPAAESASAAESA